MNNMNQNGMMMQNNNMQMQNGMMNQNYGQIQQQKPQEPDEEKLFENELQTAPQSSPNNYVYLWNKKLKKYTCYQEPHLFQNHKVEADTHQYFLEKLHELPKIDPTNTMRTLVIVGIIVFFLAAIGALIIAITSSNSTVKVIFYILMSILIIFAILAILYLILLAKKSHNKEMKLRREELRKFLKLNNKMSFHVRNRHWRPSPYCSYLTYMMDYYGDKGGGYDSNVTVIQGNGNNQGSNLSNVGNSLYNPQTSQISNGNNQNFKNNFGNNGDSSYKKLNKRPINNSNNESQSPFNPRIQRDVSPPVRNDIPVNLPRPSELVSSTRYQRDKQMNLMTSDPRPSIPKQRYSNRNEAIEQPIYKENVNYDPNPRMVISRKPTRIPPQQTSPRVVRKIASEFNKVAEPSYVVERRKTSPPVRYVNSPTTSPNGFQNPSKVLRSELQTSNQMPWADVPDRNIPLRNVEKVVYGAPSENKRITESNFMNGSDARERDRAYKQSKPIIRVTPPKGRVRHVSPVKVGGDSVILDKSIDGLLQNGGGSGLLYPPR